MYVEGPSFSHMVHRHISADKCSFDCLKMQLYFRMNTYYYRVFQIETRWITMHKALLKPTKGVETFEEENLHNKSVSGLGLEFWL